MKSTEQDLAVDALRSRVSEDFVSAPSLRGHEIVIVVDRVTTSPDSIVIQAHLMKRTGDGKELDLVDADFKSALEGHESLDIRSPYRSGVTAIMVKEPNTGNWSTLKRGILGSRAIEAYILGQTPESIEGWSEDFLQNRARQSRTSFPGQ